ncbi:hypothetical protein [Brevibacterium otitidis]|uniref:Uncharacterized protein n=1 Tax=Brevibacterium otitidis TaxID=53364 RepID=A0ABV5X1D4_9MICO
MSQHDQPMRYGHLRAAADRRRAGALQRGQHSAASWFQRGNPTAP